MTIKLQDAELKVMDVIWHRGEVSAKDISLALTERYGWKKNTTYTLIKRCIEKGAIERYNKDNEPNFICRALIPREEVQKEETNELINKIYDGSADKLVAALLGRDHLSPEQVEKLKQIVKELE